MLARDTDENRLRTIFEQYGPVKEVYIMRDINQVSKGCAFVRYESRDNAVAAIAGLHEVYRDEVYSFMILACILLSCTLKFN